MGEFSEWLLWEDVRELPTHDVELTDNGSGDYTYQFEIDGKYFTVFMHEQSIHFHGIVVRDCYDISFEGPKGFMLTGSAGHTAPKIYTQLLLAIKKLLETTTVNGFHFYPATPTMGLVYDKFYKKYLSKDFIRVSTKDYLRKSLLKQAEIANKGKAYKSIIDANREVVNNKKRIAAQKMAARQQFQKFKGRLLVRYDFYGMKIPVYILGQSDMNGYMDAIIPAMYSKARRTLLAVTDIVEEEPNAEQAKQLLIGILKELPDIAATPNFQRLLVKYGIQA